MKATLRRNGTMMFDIKVRHAIGRNEVCDAILYRFCDTNERWRELLSGLKRKNVERFIRDALEIAGGDMWARVEHYSQEARDLVCIEVDRLFPELKQGKNVLEQGSKPPSARINF